MEESSDGEEFGEEGLEGIADICEELGSEFGADALGELGEFAGWIFG